MLKGVLWRKKERKAGRICRQWFSLKDTRGGGGVSKWGVVWLWQGVKGARGSWEWEMGCGEEDTPHSTSSPCPSPTGVCTADKPRPHRICVCTWTHYSFHVVLTHTGLLIIWENCDISSGEADPCTWITLTHTPGRASTPLPVQSQASGHFIVFAFHRGFIYTLNYVHR